MKEEERLKQRKENLLDLTFQRLQPLRTEHTDHLVGRSSRIGQRAEQVEQGADPHFLAWTDGMFHRTVVHRRKHEANTDVIDAGCNLLRCHF